jgi:hypothetical protein
MTITVTNEEGGLLLTGSVDVEHRRVRALDVEESAGVLRQLFIGLPVLLGTLEAALERGQLSLNQVETDNQI